MNVDTEAVPFLDLASINTILQHDYDVAWKSVMQHGRFVGGPEVEEFEGHFSAYCGARACVGVANGTDALTLILAGLGIGPGDEVIVPANTFIATAEAVCAVGARPRFVDVLPDTLLIDPDAAAAAIRPGTAAIVAVHLFGQMADLHALHRVARRHGLALIEDAAHAHGARRRGRRAGSCSDAAAFSFYPSRNLGALGDGGAVVTNNVELAEWVRSCGDHGRSVTDRYRHVQRGCNSRLDSLQAGMLSVKLASLDTANTARRQAMEHYLRHLPPWCEPVAEHPESESVYHLAVIQVDNRAAVAASLERNRIGWGIHYPIPCHRQPAYKEFVEYLPVAERAARRVLSLPMSPSLSTAAIERVCEVLWKAPG
ncbi:putative PLP-dependent enzyme possibly involved in cell wall biogenesis [Mycolicibacterium chubuense NBB4]|uniref:Putative PLP-dependent enzyme possibly involved in cell wall biogenesis n=1 Tax=Mycolicibacterium chubuense (strain NBB4) TaxID=710421 RepID=I4BE55_MYCCN|nr:DegT/DnrJ/EryC1/StrS family aminotransferase [Mycolicibacterium chubuense]AFM15562.1 putative PLP-dependent enzyme possibly involved in cell wall biogenesis [Mycolicibacterium chubuense NBB4]